MAISSAWFESCRAIFSLKIKVNRGWPFYTDHVGSFINLADRRKTLWDDINCSARFKPILILYEKPSSSKKTFQKTQALFLLKDFERSLIHIVVCFQSLGIKCLHETNISSVRVGRGNLVETLMKKSSKVSKKHLSMIVLEVRMEKLLALLDLKLSLVLVSKKCIG